MNDFEPRPFGKYFLTEHIATGGMAEIYKAKTFGVDGFEKILAIKKILHHYSADQEFITMLTDEAKLVVNLSHANIVQVYDLGRVQDDYFISMEYIDGTNLREFIDKAKELTSIIPPEIALYIIAEVCKGLDYAHSKKDAKGESLKIVHRDVSPQNILVSRDGAVKIVDFGIAKAAMNASQTNIGILKGKVTYMAPEQAFGKPIDGRSDLFSCGIILYELLTRERLFQGESQMEILKKIRNTRITADSLPKKIPAIIRPVLSKALTYSVKERYQSAADLQIDLLRVLYSNYPDFSPKNLSDLVLDWFYNKKFPGENKKKQSREEMLASSPVSITKLNDKENSQILIDTIKPDDDVSRGKFNVDETEKSKKYALTNNEITVEEMLDNKRRQNKISNFISWSVLAISVILLFYYVGAKLDFFSQKQSVDSVNPVTPNSNMEVEKSEPATPRELPRLTDTFIPQEEEMHNQDLEPQPRELLFREAVKISPQLTEPKNEPIRTEGISSPKKTEAQEAKITTKKLDSNVATYGKLRLDSSPRGASVKINGVGYGITPLVVGDLPKNRSLNVVITKKDYQTWSSSITLIRDKTEIKANLVR